MQGPTLRPDPPGVAASDLAHLCAGDRPGPTRHRNAPTLRANQACRLDIVRQPASFIRLTVDPKLALASAVWLLRPTAEHTRRMLRLFVAPGADPPETEVAWMALMATCCRTTLAPPPLSAELPARRAERPCVVGVGEHDRFLPPHRLAPAARRTMNLDVRVFSGVGHLTTPAHLDEVVSLVAEVVDPPANGVHVVRCTDPVSDSATPDFEQLLEVAHSHAYKHCSSIQVIHAGPCAYGSSRSSDTNHNPTVRAKIGFGAHRLRIGVVGQA
jgi:hypothetical protein